MTRHFRISCFPHLRRHAAAKTPSTEIDRFPATAASKTSKFNYPDSRGLYANSPNYRVPYAKIEWRSNKPLTEIDRTPEVTVEAVVESGGELFDLTSTGSEETQYAWASKHRPRALKDIICNRDRAEELLDLVTKGQCSHFIFEGPPGVGKRTMVLALLREAFGAEKLKTKAELKKIEVKGEFVTSIDLNVKISHQHVEVNLSEVCGYEKHVIAALINEFSTPVNEAKHCDHTKCRVIVLHEAEKLSSDAQHYVRWLMEKYKGCNKIFFCCFDSSKLHTIKHLCKVVKLQPPSNNEIVEVLEFIAKKEEIELPHHMGEKLAENSKHNLRQAIRSFEASCKSDYLFKENQEILTGWEDDIAKIAKNIIEDQSPKQLYTVRGELKQLKEHNVSPDFVFSTLVMELKKHLDDKLQVKLDVLYHKYINVDNGFILDEMFSCGRKGVSGIAFTEQMKNCHQFMRIEEFTAKFMSFYKSAATKDAEG